MFEAHFQSFEDRGARGSAPRLAALRAELKRRGLDGFIVPRADRYQNEYVPPCAERLGWLTGFTGSAGVAIVLADRAVLFVDGRYHGAGARRSGCGGFHHRTSGRASADGMDRGESAGRRQARLFAVAAHRRRRRAARQSLRSAGGSLVAVADNPIDACWRRPPPPPLGAVVLHDLRYAGEDATAKLARVLGDLQKIRADALVVSDPQAVCWLFNIRGSDVPHTPVTLAFALVPKEGRPSLYIDGRKLGDDVRHRLEGLAEIRVAGRFRARSAALGQAQSAVRLDPAACPEAMTRLVPRPAARSCAAAIRSRR